MSVREAFNIRELGDPTAPPMIFAHGFGCEQGMWRFVAPHFAATRRVILFDHMGLGGSDASGYDPVAYESLHTYADDVLRICDELELRDVIFVGHSVSASIGLLAARQRPELFAELVLVSPSPCFIDDPAHGYRGGFTRADIDELLAAVSTNYLGWANTIAPVIMGAPDGDPLTDELAETFCRADPEVASAFARATFLSDCRADLPHVAVRSLVIQTAHDVIAPRYVGRWVADHLPDAEYVELDAVGHCPNMSAPQLTTAAIEAFL